MQRFIVFVLLVWLGLASLDASANVYTVTNTSSKPPEATLPSSVTIPAGATSATFAVKAVDDTILDGPQSVVLSSSASGHTTGTFTMTVTDNESGAATTFHPSQVTLSSAEASVSSQSVILTFSDALDENSAATVAHYAVDVNGAAVRVQSANYNVKTNTVTLLLPNGSLQNDDEVVVAWHELHSALEQIMTGQSPLFKAH